MSLARPLRWLAGLIGLVTACILAGVAATTLWPATAQTRHFEADLRLSPDPARASTVHVPTLFGDLDVHFNGLAPGIVALPQVKASITDVLSRPGVTVSSVAPGPLELEAAVRDAAISLGTRYAAGAAIAALVALGVVALARRRRPSRAAVAICLSAWLVSLAGTGLGVWRTYQPTRTTAYAATGVLGTVQQNAGLLREAQARADQSAPYLMNVLALSQALRQRYQPAEAGEPVVRLLVVSDVHGGNQYGLMRRIVQEEDIDAVLDLGDLVSFGRVEELEAAGIPGGIASLGVPYLFVSGNHDTTSADDNTVRQRLARIGNVVVLQPDSQNYREVEMGGLRLAGFNDPRWFGDDGKRSAAKQQPAIERFNATFDGRELDVVLAHEPAAAQGTDLGRVSLNGHIHTPALAGNRVQAGTFTGGGPSSHYVTSEDGAELTGQPSSFDVLSFAADCSLTTLERYTWRGLLEGRPAFDDVSVINGARVATPLAEDAGRTCAKPTSAPVVTDVPAAPATP
ncbi:metallophosphoesterase family protein [Actinomycetota bacterium]